MEDDPNYATTTPTEAHPARTATTLADALGVVATEFDRASAAGADGLRRRIHIQRALADSGNGASIQ